MTTTWKRKLNTISLLLLFQPQMVREWHGESTCIPPAPLSTLSIHVIKHAWVHWIGRKVAFVRVVICVLSCCFHITRLSLCQTNQVWYGSRSNDAHLKPKNVHVNIYMHVDAFQFQEELKWTVANQISRRVNMASTEAGKRCKTV